MIRHALLLLALASSPAWAQRRTFMVTSFDHVRVNGPFEVHVVAGRSPGARADGNRAALDGVDVHQNGNMLVVQTAGGKWGERPSAGQDGAAVITLTTPNLVGASVNGGGGLTVAGMKGQRVDLSVMGSSTLAVAGAQADQLTATLVGTGSMTLGGNALRATLNTNGPGTIIAEDLTVRDLTILVDGAGETRARALYTAKVTDTGLGKVSVVGPAVCTIRAPVGAAVTCQGKRIEP